MSAAVVTTAFEHIEEARKVGVRIGVRIGQGVAHARLGGEVHDRGKAVGREKLRHAGTISEIELVKLETWKLRQLVEACLLELRIVVSVEVVDSDDSTAVAGEAMRYVIADKAGGPVTSTGRLFVMAFVIVSLSRGSGYLEALPRGDAETQGGGNIRMSIDIQRL